MYKDRIDLTFPLRSLKDGRGSSPVHYRLEGIQLMVRISLKKSNYYKCNDPDFVRLFVVLWKLDYLEEE
jgi:hypothetical protein